MYYRRDFLVFRRIDLARTSEPVTKTSFMGCRKIDVGAAFTFTIAYKTGN